jgi:uncharacterized protein DUF4105
MTRSIAKSSRLRLPSGPARRMTFVVALALLGALAAPDTSWPGCRLAPGDPFDPDAAMVGGRFRGRCLDTREQRSAVLLRDRSGARKVVLANLRHADRFWIAEVGPEALEDVIFQTEYFPAVVPAAHVELRFRFRPGQGPRLTPQVPDDGTAPVRIDDLVFSVEAVSLVDGEPYDLVKGLFGHFGTAYRLVSLDDRRRDMVVKQRHRVTQLRLRLTPRQERAVLAHTLHLSDQSGMRVVYNTATRNCASELFRVIDRAVPLPPARRALAWGGGFLRSIPTAAEQALALRGLLEPGGGSRLPDLDREPSTATRSAAN